MIAIENFMNIFLNVLNDTFESVFGLLVYKAVMVVTKQQKQVTLMLL